MGLKDKNSKLNIFKKKTNLFIILKILKINMVKQKNTKARLSNLSDVLLILWNQSAYTSRNIGT